ncbi:MAG: hypothetical protein J5577_05100 [Bacteroidales bacterium]|nr:hypothetical protein [Bacteroidales bacterium]MBR4817782.1 hypothetical protein [Bacteroidales bacterium]MBR5054409.1 hypothetical protein [Bacteroidales bacterium]
MKDTTKAFFRHLLSVVLGIIITFSVQGILDRARVQREVSSALELVRAELVANIDDIHTMSEHMRQERKSAKYFLDNRLTLAKCPADSIYYHTGVIFAEASITMTHDALELLKMSSLFQKIGDNETSMKIIRAYDSCEYAVANLNSHIATRNEMVDKSINESNVRRLAGNGVIDIKEYIKTGYGQYVIRWLSSQVGPEYYADVSDLDAAITAIDKYLSGKPKRR